MPVHRSTGLTKGTTLFQYDLPIYVNRSHESFDLMEHRHDFIEICIIGEGAGTHYINEKVLSVAQGDIFFIPVGISHVFRPVSARRQDPLIVYNCVLTVDFFHELLHSYPISPSMIDFFSGSDWLQFRDKHGEFLGHFQKIHHEYSMKRPCFEAALHTGLMELLLYLYRSENEHATHYESPSLGMDAVFHYLHTHYNQHISLRSVSALRGIGERHFHRLFKKHTGMNLTEYIQGIRIKEACQLLRTTEQKISDVAASVGYQDIKFFNRLFKKKAGVTPKQYRIDNKPPPTAHHV